MSIRPVFRSAIRSAISTWHGSHWSMVQYVWLIAMSTSIAVVGAQARAQQADDPGDPVEQADSADVPAEAEADDAPSDSAAEAPSGEDMIREAYRISKEAQTVEELTAVIETCQQGLADPDVSESMRQYAHKLLAWTYDKRGLLLDEAGQSEEALADFDQAIHFDPTRWQAVHNRGVSYARLGEYEKAIADFDRTIELNPNYANAYFNRGELHYELGEFRRAIADYNQCLRLQPRDAAALNSRGHAYYRLGNYRSAISDYNRAIRVDPRNAAAYTNRGDAYADLGMYRQAAQDYRAAIRIDPKMGRAYQSAAWLMATCPDARYRETEKAISAARRAIELDGQSYRYLDTLAAAYANAGQFEKAREIQARVVEMAPPELAANYEARLRLYEQNQPFRDILPPGRQQIGARRARRS